MAAGVVITQAEVRATFDYAAETGRLVRVRPGLGARVGREIGSVDPANGHRRAFFRGANRMTAHLVWLWHNGEMPSGILRHGNGDNSDDRIENLSILKKQLSVAYPSPTGEVSQFGRLPKEISSGIYEIVCTANGRRYVGSATKIESRWRLHYTQLCRGDHHSRHLLRAWSKYGEGAFVFRVIEQCAVADLIAREQHYIDTLNPEFNSRPNAASQLGWRPSVASRERMRKAHLGQSSPMKGRKHTPESLAKISASRKGKGGGPMSAERRMKIGAAHKGRVIPSEIRARISATLTGTTTGRGSLTPVQVREVRRLRDEGLGKVRIARALCISESAATAVIGGHAYLWVA